VFDTYIIRTQILISMVHMPGRLSTQPVPRHSRHLGVACVTNCML